MKIMEKRHIKREGKGAAVMMERAVLSRCAHPCIVRGRVWGRGVALLLRCCLPNLCVPSSRSQVRLYWTFQDAENLYFVMDLCRGRELSRLISAASAAAAAAAPPAGPAPTHTGLVSGAGALPPSHFAPSAPHPAGLPPPLAAFYTAQAVAALEYLHCTLKVVHRDVKPENMLLTERGMLKLSDFGVRARVGCTRALVVRAHCA